jgi:DNA repair protein RadC
MKNNFDYPTDTCSQYKTIREWREDERPREKLMMHGPTTLSDAELLAILIGQGTKKFSAVDVAKEILNRFNNLRNLASIDLSEFKHIRGVGNAKAVTLIAAVELSRRIQAEPVNDKKLIRTPDDVAKYYIPRFMGARTEKFLTLLLNSANQVFREVIISEGSLNASIAQPREIFRLAITESSASIILVHNHPSGNAEPSKEDISITQKLKEAGKLLEIEIIDHIIIAGNTFTSFAKRGLI